MLEDHADFLPAAADFRLAQRHQVSVLDKDLAGGRAFEQVEAPHQRALARAGQTDDAENIAFVDLQRHVAQRFKVFLSVGKHLLNML